MKKFIIIFLVVFTSMVTAQEYVTYGVKGGFNVTNIADIHGDSAPRYGFHAGGFATIPLSRHYMYYLQPEISYSLQGEKNDAAINLNELYKLNYINVPVLFKPYFSDTETAFYALIGPQLGFLVFEEVKTGDRDQDPKYVNDKYNTFDLSALVGVGFSIQRKIEFEVRYAYGFIDVVDGGIDNGKQDNVKNRSSNLHFSIAYKIF